MDRKAELGTVTENFNSTCFLNDPPVVKLADVESKSCVFFDNVDSSRTK